MNTNEAIQKIKRVKGLYAYESDYEALDMAIAALEKQERETQEKPFPLVVGQPAEIFCNEKWENRKRI